jgi:hypothetical protein
MRYQPSIPDDPARTAGPGELDSDRAFWDSIDVEPSDDELEEAFAPLMDWAEMQLRAELQEEAEGVIEGCDRP